MRDEELKQGEKPPTEAQEGPSPVPRKEKFALQPVPRDFSGADLSGYRATILVVDDDPQALLLYERALTGQGYQVLTAPTGEEALIIIKGAKPDLVLLDYKLPDMNGIQLLQEVRKTNDSVPVIMLTGNDSVRVVELAAREGISSFLLKPVKLDLLFHRIQEALQVVEKPPLV